MRLLTTEPLATDVVLDGLAFLGALGTQARMRARGRWPEGSWRTTVSSREVTLLETALDRAPDFRVLAVPERGRAAAVARERLGEWLDGPAVIILDANEEHREEDCADTVRACRQPKGMEGRCE